MVGFVLFDPQDPMAKIVEKVNVGERPALLSGRNAKPQKGFHRRHRIAHDIIAKALRKMLKGKSLGQIAEWLDRDEAWLDRANARTDRKPADGTGRVVRTVYGVQEATENWLKNATNFAANIFEGDKKTNMELGRQYVLGRDGVKASWEGPSMLLSELHAIYCIESSSGFMSPVWAEGSRFAPGSNIVQAIAERWHRSKQMLFRVEPGMRWVAIPTAEGMHFETWKKLVGAEWMTLFASRIRSIRILGGAFIIYPDATSGAPRLQKVSRDFDFKRIGPTTGQNHALTQAQRRFISGGVDENVPLDQANVHRYINRINNLTVMDPSGQTVKIFEVAIGGLGRGKYVQGPNLI